MNRAKIWRNLEKVDYSGALMKADSANFWTLGLTLKIEKNEGKFDMLEKKISKMFLPKIGWPTFCFEYLSVVHNGIDWKRRNNS